MAAAAAAMNAAISSKLQVPALKSKEDYPTWRWKLNGQMMAIGILPQWNVLVDNPVPAGQAIPTINNAVPPLNADQLRKYNVLEGTGRSAFQGDIAAILTGRNDDALTEQVKYASSSK